MECSICYEKSITENVYIKINCHKFCPCVMPWILEKQTCPLCRNTINDFKYKFNTKEQNIVIREKTYTEINMGHKYAKILFFSLLLSNCCSIIFFVRDFSHGVEMFLINQVILQLVMYVETTYMQ